nr:class I SAM-dependent methyltransferase [Mycobacterium spongiae]
MDLSAGTGRVSNALAAQGHTVTAVDDSPAMPEHVPCARTVQARIEHVRLAERFDAVLLTSNLINYPGTPLLRSILATASHHVAPAAQVIIE